MSQRNSYPSFNSQGSRRRNGYRGRHAPYRHRRRNGGGTAQPQQPAPIEHSASAANRALSWFRAAQQWLGGLLGRNHVGIPSDGLVIGGAELGFGALLNGMDWENVRTNVERESQAHVILAGAANTGKTTLLYRLKGLDEGTIEPIDYQDIVADPSEEPLGEEQPAVSENFGFFAVLDLLPGKPPNSSNGYFEGNGVWGELESADLIVWVLDGVRGLHAWEYEWISRVRSLGKPLLVVCNKQDEMKNLNVLARWQQALGIEILSISARDGTNVMTQLVPRMADAIPSLATALGREVVEWRRTAAERIMRRAATLSGLVGLEPVPLLDLPFQITIQLQMVLRIGAIYGQPLRDQYGREMLVTMVSAVAVRFVGGQLAKVVPLVGWVISGVLAAGGTWAIGRIALEYFEHGRQVPLPSLPRRERHGATTADKPAQGTDNPKKRGGDIAARLRGLLKKRSKEELPASDSNDERTNS